MNNGPEQLKDQSEAEQPKAKYVYSREFLLQFKNLYLNTPEADASAKRVSEALNKYGLLSSSKSKPLK